MIEPDPEDDASADGEVRTVRLYLRLTPGERELVHAAARADARTVSDWARLAMMRAAGETLVREAERRGQGAKGRP